MTIASSSPCRLSLFGGGTDVGEYASKYGGVCVNLAINIRQDFIIGNLPSKQRSEFVDEILKELDASDLNYYQTFDGEITGGLGSSAAATVTIVGAVNKIKGLGMNKMDIAEKAWDIEVNHLGLYGGRQDQYVAAIGGINAMEFSDRVTVVPLSYNFLDKILPGLCLFHSGFNRESPHIQEGLRIITDEQKKTLDTIKKTAYEAVELIGKGDIEAVGNLMDVAWELKKKSNKGVSNPKLDELFVKAKSLGVWGQKCLGAGGGGYVIMMIDPDKKEKLIEEIGIKHIDFEVDFQGLSTRAL